MLNQKQRVQDGRMLYVRLARDKAPKGETSMETNREINHQEYHVLGSKKEKRKKKKRSLETSAAPHPCGSPPVPVPVPEPKPKPKPKPKMNSISSRRPPAHHPLPLPTPIVGAQPLSEADTHEGRDGRRVTRTGISSRTMSRWVANQVG